MNPLLTAFTLLAMPILAAEFYEAEGEDQPNHLVPIKRWLPDYDQRIEEHLFKTDASLGRFVVRPSFFPESCVSVYSVIPEEVKKQYEDRLAFVTDNERKYFITVTHASASLWLSMAENNKEKKIKEVEVIRTDREISMELAVAIQRVWGKMLHLTRYPAKLRLGLDGGTYQFSVYVPGLGDLEGEVWSPDRGLPAEMVSLGDALAEFASDPDAEEKPLIERLRAFEKKIPKAES